MGSGSEKPAGRRRKRYGWRKPRWRDGAFWIAIALAGALIALQGVFVLDRDDSLTWVVFAFRVVVTWLVISAIIRIRRGLPRGLVDGFEEAERNAQAKPSGQSAPERVARVSGKVLGTALGAFKKRDSDD